MYYVDFAQPTSLESVLMVFDAKRHRKKALLGQRGEFDDVLSAEISQHDCIRKRLGLAAMRALAQFFRRNLLEAAEAAGSVAEIALERDRWNRELQLYDALRRPDRQAETIETNVREPKQIRRSAHEVLPHNVRRVRIRVGYREFEGRQFFCATAPVVKGVSVPTSGNAPPCCRTTTLAQRCAGWARTHSIADRPPRICSGVVGLDPGGPCATKAATMPLKTFWTFRRKPTAS